MAQIEVEYGDSGERLLIENDVATERTLTQLTKNMEGLGTTLKGVMTDLMKQSGKNEDEIKEILEKNDTKKIVDAVNTQTENDNRNTDRTINAYDKAEAETNRQRKKQFKAEQDAKKVGSFFQRKMGDNFSYFGSLLQKLVTGLFAVGVTGVGVFFSSIQNLGNGLKTLTDVGGAFGDVQKQGRISTIENITQLNQLGLTTDQAVNILSNFSQTAAVLGQSALPRLNRQFLELTEFGTELGVALDDATQFFQEDLAFRTSILLRDRINQFETARASEQQIKNLRMFSTLLGRSADDLRNESRAIIDNDKAFQQLLVTLGPMGEEVLNATDSLFQGLKGANIPDQLLAGILQIATVGAESASEFVNQLLPFAPELNRELTTLAMDIRAGGISMNSVPDRVLSVLNSLETADPGRLKELVAGLQGELAEAASAVIQFSVDARNARRNFETGPLEGRFSDVQTALTNFENVLKLGQGALSTFKNSLVLGAADGLKGFSEALGTASDANSRLSQIASRVGIALGDIFSKFVAKIFGANFTNNFDATLDKIVKGLNDFGDQLIEFVEDIMEGFFDDEGKFQLVRGLTNYLSEALAVGLQIFFEALKIAVGVFFSTLAEQPGLIAKVAGMFALLLLGTAVVTGLQTAFFAMWMGLSPAMLKSWNLLMLKMSTMMKGGITGIFGGGGKKGGGIGRNLMRGGVFGLTALGVGMVANAGSNALGETTTGGRVVDTLGDVGQGALFGAAVGSIVPVIGTAIGAAIGGGIGLLKDMFFDDDGIASLNKKKTQEKQLEVAEKQQQEMQMASIQQRRRSGLSLSFLDSAAGAESTGGMSIGEEREIDEQSTEAKLLTLILSESKISNKKLTEINNKPGI